MIFETAEIERVINYEFTDKNLLRKCFTHSSYANENKEEDNELLECFGDAVIEFIVTEYLYQKKVPDEKTLTQYRQFLVKDETLKRESKKLGLDGFMLLGVGQSRSAKKDEKLFSSVYEALVAGIYIDGGMAKAEKFVRKTLIADFERLMSKEKAVANSDAKTRLQEYVQKRKIGSISYEFMDKSGSEHEPVFRIDVLLNGNRLEFNGKVSEGKGKSKKVAETAAAERALEILEEQQKQKEQEGNLL